jgi:large-conductance mechanosensitive channel
MLDSLKEFIISNNIITTMAAVTIAFSTGTMIRSLAGDIILPTLYALIFYRFKTFSGAFAPINKLNTDNFIKEFLSWIIVIIFTFILIGYVFNLWVSSAKKKEETKSTSVAGASVTE